MQCTGHQHQWSEVSGMASGLNFSKSKCSDTLEWCGSFWWLASLRKNKSVDSAPSSLPDCREVLPLGCISAALCADWESHHVSTRTEKLIYGSSKKYFRSLQGSHQRQLKYNHQYPHAQSTTSGSCQNLPTTLEEVLGHVHFCSPSTPFPRRMVLVEISISKHSLSAVTTDKLCQTGLLCWKNCLYIQLRIVTNIWRSCFTQKGRTSSYYYESWGASSLASMPASDPEPEQIITVEMIGQSPGIWGPPTQHLHMSHKPGVAPWST